MHSSHIKYKKLTEFNRKIILVVTERSSKYFSERNRTKQKNLTAHKLLLLFLQIHESLKYSNAPPQRNGH